MELTREMLLERRRALEADVIAINGAIQQIDWSLEVLEEGAAAPSSDPHHDDTEGQRPERKDGP